MDIRLVSLEDGTTANGFRRLAAYAAEIEPSTRSLYVSTNRWSSIVGAIKGTMGDKPEMGPEHLDEIADGLVGADVVGFGSMTGYADLTRAVSARLRERSPETYQVWGGIHPIIHPEDAIEADVDAICVGEGEYAIAELLEQLRAGERPARIRNMWFKRPDGSVERNHFRPLMTNEEMDTMPFPQYGDERELVYRAGEGFVPMGLDDYLANDGLSYTAIWSIGCPFHCTYCGNTAFIANDKAYKRIRHPSARYVVEEVKRARARFPHLSHVSFLDDSFMAIPYAELQELAELWRAELDIPFAVYGVIPNYVKDDKFELLTWGGMNRIRMGVQSGSQRILDFYRRPSPPEKILAAGAVNAKYAQDGYHLPPAYDVILDNPIETRQDVRDTLNLFWEMPRPYTLLIYSLKVIPNTQLAEDMESMGIDLEAIDRSYQWIPPKWANLMMYLLAVWRPPTWLWTLLLRRVRASSEEQPLYPKLALVLRTLYLVRRGLQHMKAVDFSIIPGKSGYWAYKAGLVGFYQRRLWKRPAKPVPSAKRLREAERRVERAARQAERLAQQAALDVVVVPGEQAA